MSATKEASMPLPLVAVFADIPDPRRDTENKLHRLGDILVLATCAVIGGAESWDSIHEYGKTKKEFFLRFLTLPNGIPSADTFERVFAKLDPEAFSRAFGGWMRAACEGTGLIPVAVDGKSVRRSKKGTATGCLHVVSAWATSNRLTLGQVSVPDGSNEIAVLPELLAVLELKGALVTLDAAGCQKAIAKQIRDQGGDYLLAVKGNQPNLHAAVQQVFAMACEQDFAAVLHTGDSAVEDGHGRHEERYVTVITDPKGLPEGWSDVAAVVQINREREVGGQNASCTHYYITSHRGSTHQVADLVRGHWGIENGLHWILDVVFREDESRKRAGHAGANLAMIRRVAVSLLRRAPGKGSSVTKRLKAGWDDEYLLQVLQGIPGDIVR
jgi:predicted transposase YbfD/YdcC